MVLLGAHSVPTPESHLGAQVSPPQRAVWSEMDVGSLAEATFLPAQWRQEAGSVRPLGVTHVK